MPDTYTHDAIIIGVGQANNAWARQLAAAGWRTAVVERKHVGGTCVNEGCTPTKTMVASARVAYLARRGADYGVQTGPVTVDQAVVRQRKRAIVEQFRGGIQKAMHETDGIDFIHGEASFVDANTVAVQITDGGARTISAPKIFINTGARPAIPALPGLD